MKAILTYILIVAGLICFGFAGITLYKTYQLNQARLNIKSSPEYTQLNQSLGEWADQYSLPTPTLEFRFNKTNEGYYNAQANSITILATLNDWQNLEFLKSLLAHEFGHHYISIHLSDLTGPDQELAADFIAKDLVGLENYLKALEKGLGRGADENHLNVEKRIEILTQYPENHILPQ